MWPRREHFNLYNTFDHPHFGLCANVDITELYPYVKQRQISINVAIIYILVRAANAIPEFRQRIRGGGVVEHEVVHPSTTVMADKVDIFSFCQIEFCKDFPEFSARADQQIANAKKRPTLKNKPGKDDLLFLTAIPWVSFTSFIHPANLQPPDSVPRLSWGKFFEEGQSIKMPLGVQVHHALMDGKHVGRFYEEVQRLFDRPGRTLS
ncbi:CatA-like O-acetyltransferase [Chloroflexota bacterium]